MVPRPDQVNLSFTGIASFAKFPIADGPAGVRADVAILGIPWDEGVSYRPGARFGPRAIREYSTRFGFHERGIPAAGWWDPNTRRRYLAGARVVDCGDVDVLFLDQTTTFNRATEAVAELVRAGAFPVVLGGDHSVTFPAVRALDQTGPLDVIHIDAHLDYNDDVFGVRLANGNPFKRVSELSFVNRIVQVGMRGIRTRQDAYEDSERRGNLIVTMDEVRRIGIGGVLERIGRLGRTYVSLDIDAFDPSVAPGTGSPDPDGFAHWQVRDLLRGLAEQAEVVGFDLVEVNPLIDGTGLTASLAAQTILEFLGFVFARKSGAQ